MSLGINNTGYTNSEILSGSSLRLDSVVDIKKEQEPLKPTLDEWKDNNEKLRSSSPFNQAGAVYEKSDVKVDNSTYSINKMNKADRSAIAEAMRREADNQRQSLINMVKDMLGKQGQKAKEAGGFDPFGGTVTEEARRKAAQDISEDGYWGVKQTSQRLFDFASALAGDDVEKMKKMQEAMNKGINQAAAKLGGLPSISRDTQEAANSLFDEYYKSKGVEV